ncbi:MAG: hypothetical protein KDA24_05885 [Deltaproteobacteria bacterium]|nr:hypothetical protein [Deltaproteobacteria bacterium]
MTIPSGVPDRGEGPTRISFIYKHLRDAALQVLWTEGRREDAIALRGWFRHLEMIQELGGPNLHRRLARRELARDAMRALVKQSVRAPVVGSPFLRHARLLADGGREERLADDWGMPTQTIQDTDPGPATVPPDDAAWTHHRYQTLQSAFDVVDEELEVFETDRERVIYVAAGRVELLPLDGGDTPLWTARAGEVIGAVAALTGGTARFRARLKGTVSLGEIDAGRFHEELARDAHLSLSLVRELVLQHRARPVGTVVYGLTPGKASGTAHRGLPERAFRQLTEGLRPSWREPGAPLYQYGGFADAVYLVEWGELLRARGPVELSLLSTTEEMHEELAQLEASLRADGALLPPGGHRLQLTGFWSALLPLDDPMVSGSKGRGRNGTPPGTGVRGADEGTLRRGPQPERHEISVVVGGSGAMVYTLPREEFISRLEADPTLAYEVCSLVVRWLAAPNVKTSQSTQAFDSLAALLQSTLTLQPLRKTRQLTRPPRPKASK